MIGFYAAGAMGTGGGGPTPPASPEYIGGAFHVNQSASTVTLNVPAEAQPGDTVIVVLRCRVDRSMSGFSGWTTKKSQFVQSDPTTSRVYVLERTLASETSFSFTHSASAAYGAALLVYRGGSILQDALPDSKTASLNKLSDESILLAVSLGNGDAASPAGEPVITGFTRRGFTSFFSSPNYHYVAICEDRAGVAAGPVSVTANYGTGTQAALYLAEIG